MSSSRPGQSGSELTPTERALADVLSDGGGVVVNVRRGGPHMRLVPWLVDRDLLTYVGHAGGRHSWPASDFANPYYRDVKTDRPGVITRYRDWLADQPELLDRIAAGELSGLALGCWCAPLACHADVLLERAEQARCAP